MGKAGKGLARQPDKRVFAVCKHCFTTLCSAPGRWYGGELAGLWRLAGRQRSLAQLRQYFNSRGFAYLDRAGCAK